LVRSDLYPKDRQNYASCVKISSPTILKLLKRSPDTKSLYVYLKLLNYLIIAYVDKTTTILDRLKYSWICIFVCRLWWAWLTLYCNTTNKRTIEKHFITNAAQYSIEINGHNLLYIIMLVLENKIPKDTVNTIHLFSSQPCESIFRNTRSLSGVYSTIVNFTVKDFLKRAQKLSILNKIKCFETANDNANRLLFPIHHKHLKDNRNLNNSNHNNIDNVTTDDVEKIILSAYETAKVLIDNLKMCKLLKENKIYTLKQLSTYISNSLRSSSNVTDNTMIDDDVDNESDTSSSSGNEDNDYYGEDDESENISEGEDDDKIPLDHFAQVRNTTFSGMRIVESVPRGAENSYFTIKINNADKYIHKTTACWLLTQNNNRLPSDRLSRVIATSRKE
ncbi:unnamed protein product, partial [Didymodactylos carnosus]